jgi:hypothetical protein
MQTVQLKKFGKVLVSRPAGLEAFNAIRPTLNKEELIQIDFEGTLAVTPAWFDEFLTNLAEYVDGNVELLPTENESVLVSLPVLANAKKDKASEVIQRFLDKNSSSGN